MQSWNAMMLKLQLIFLCFISAKTEDLSISDDSVVSYKGHQVYDVMPQTESHLQFLTKLENDTDYIKFWSQPHKTWKNVLVQISPEALIKFQRELKDRMIPFAVKINDLQKKIDAEKEENYPQMLFRVMGAEAFDLGQYHTLDEINMFLELLQGQYPDITNLNVIGKSFEGRDIKLFHIGSPNTARKPKPAVLIDAGIHAREWIAPATSLYLIKKLLSTNDTAIANLREAFDWYFIPVLNPDGYVYTWAKDRMWRKSRKPNGRLLCFGVDLNRNFDIGFKTAKFKHPCSEIYAGSSPFSEPETSAIMKFASSLGDRLKMTFSLHSFSQVWVTPYIYKFGYPSHYPKLEHMLVRALALAKKVNQVEYTYGPGALLMYPASGTSVDWFSEVLGVKYAFIVELRDKGDHGFLLPKNQIFPTGEETWVAMKDIAQHVTRELLTE